MINKSNRAHPLRLRAAAPVGAAILAAFLALSLSACAKPPVKVGLPLVLTGLTSRIGIAGRNGALLAAERINAAGGIRGRRLELLPRDDFEDPDKALEVDQALAEEGAVALVGHMASRTGLKAVEFATRRRLPLISPTISSTDYSGKDDYFFRIIGSNALMGKTLAAYARKTGLSRAAAAYESTNRSYTVPFFEGFKAEFERLGGVVLKPRSFATSASLDYGAMVEELLAEGPDAVFVVASPFDTAEVCQALQTRGSPLPVLAAMWAMTDDLFAFGGRSVERLVGVMYLDPEDDSPAYRAFREEYSRRYGEEPSFASAYGYDAVMVLAKAMAAARRLDGPSIKEALLGIGRFDGLQGRIVLDRYGDCEKEPFVFRVRDGRFQRAP